MLRYRTLRTGAARQTRRARSCQASPSRPDNRDAITARHSAAVARYSREVARLLGLSERDQDLIHTAGLLHDIGKFIFPDSILIADLY